MAVALSPLSAAACDCLRNFSVSRQIQSFAFAFLIAALALAKLKLEQGELEAAQAQLQWTLDNTDSDTVRHTARLRLARVMLAQNNPDGAEKLLTAERPEGGFAALYSLGCVVALVGVGSHSLLLAAAELLYPPRLHLGEFNQLQNMPNFLFNNCLG